MYRYTTFDGVWLPDAMPEDDLGTGPAAGTIVDSLAGSFDYLGSSRYRPKRQPITYRGSYTAAYDYLVDENGDYVVDESGNYIISTTSTEEALRDKLNTLKAKIGMRAVLMREEDTDGSRQYKLARLLDVRHIRIVGNADRVATLELPFEADGRPWRSVTQSETTATLSASATTTVTVTPGGTEEIGDAVISITANGGTVTALEVTADGGVHWSFGTIADGSELLIDCGAMTVLRDGIDNFELFVLEATHTAEGWLPLSPGSNEINFIVTGGPADLSITYREQWR